MPPANRRRTGLSSSGLDTVIPPAPEPTTAGDDTSGAEAGSGPGPQPTPGQGDRAAAKTSGPAKVKLSGYVSPEVAEQMRDALIAVGGGATVGEFMEEALTREVTRLAEEHNGGRPFPPRARRRLARGPRPN